MTTRQQRSKTQYKDKLKSKPDQNPQNISLTKEQTHSHQYKANLKNKPAQYIHITSPNGTQESQPLAVHSCTLKDLLEDGESDTMPKL